MKKILLTLMVFGSFGAFAEDIYLECESVGNYRDSTTWIDDSCQITKKAKQYYEIHNDEWKYIERRSTKFGEPYTKSDGNLQRCGDTIEPFQTLVERAKKIGQAIDSDSYEGADRYKFFHERSGLDVLELSEGPVGYTDNMIFLKHYSMIRREFLELERINRVTGVVIDFHNKSKSAECKSINKSQYQKIIRDWNDGYKKIKQAEQERKKF